MSVSRFLRRHAAGEGRGDGEVDAFLDAAPPRLYDFSQPQQRRDEGPCLLTLQRCIAGWGVRRRIRYVSNRRACRAPHPPPVRRPAAVAAQGGDQSSSNAEKRNRRVKGEEEVKTEEEETAEDEEEGAEAEEGGEDKSRVVTTEKKRKRKRKKGGRNGGGVKRAKKIQRREEREREPVPKVDEAEPAPRRSMIARWTADRYASAEKSMLGVLLALTARASGLGYVRRTVLREEARKHIGDTGLLDHLLKHMADKVLAGSDQRFRRRHNADGAMEFWLEPAGLAAVRRQAGVSDPYWVPPPGWKPGDPVSPDACVLQVKKKVDELATELAGAKRQMKQLRSNVMEVSKGMKSEAEKAYNAWKGKYDCMVKANGNLKKQVLSLEEKYEFATKLNGELEEELLFLKEKYEATLENNTRLEKQMAELSTSFMSLKDDLFLLNTGEQLMMELEQADLFVKETSRADKEGNVCRALDAAADLFAGSQPVDSTAVDGDGTGSIGGADVRAGCGKRTSRKCSMRICKPEGTLQWPDMALLPPVLAPLSPLTPMAEAGITIAGDANAMANLASMDELNEFMMAGGLPTPPSASSTNAAAGKLPLMPVPSSPVQLPPPTTSAVMDVLQTAQPYSGALAMQLRHTDTPPSSSPAPPCGASLLEGKPMLDAGAGRGGNIGTELALATPSY